MRWPRGSPPRNSAPTSGSPGCSRSSRTPHSCRCRMRSREMSSRPACARRSPRRCRGGSGGPCKWPSPYGRRTMAARRAPRRPPVRPVSPSVAPPHPNRTRCSRPPPSTRRTIRPLRRPTAGCSSEAGARSPSIRSIRVTHVGRPPRRRSPRTRGNGPRSCRARGHGLGAIAGRPTRVRHIPPGT